VYNGTAAHGVFCLRFGFVLKSVDLAVMQCP